MANMSIWIGDGRYGDNIDGVGSAVDTVECRWSDSCGCCASASGVGGVAVGATPDSSEVGADYAMTANCIFECVDVSVDWTGELVCALIVHRVDTVMSGVPDPASNGILVVCYGGCSDSLSLTAVLCVSVHDTNHGEVVTDPTVRVWVVGAEYAYDGSGTSAE